MKLNIPLFLGRHKQLTKEEAESELLLFVYIHVERAIGQKKQFAILRSTVPLTMARLINQIVYVCVCLTSFQPALVPAPDESDDCDESEVDEYLDTLFDYDYDAQSELSDDEDLLIINIVLLLMIISYCS